ncbi:PREDICTED: leukotriene A-4 hydrolase-like [Acromyrmex echinatior]|uniref:leukotriene A-4 hydrolase-like n=1 Tax=Acromyrmex echinatior TaxID=103372 RepID=UPI000580F918|nr:PREDICTED: leukotriene A-4 hydrolase-like [Acromyrmex echinatior]
MGFIIGYYLEKLQREYFKMALSPGDPHSFSRPEFARVTNIHLELYVDFNRCVLKGKAILTIEKKCSITEIILDNYALVIERVTNPVTDEILKYSVGHQHIVGSPFTIQLPQTEEKYLMSTCKIQIEYETSPNSPALYWLTPAQTADGTHPFLLSNNKSSISLPRYTICQIFIYCYAKQVAAYAVTIAVGSLQKERLSSRSNVFAEKKFINEAVNTFRTGVVEKMLRIAEDLFGSYFWDRCDICLLPPCLGHFEIECPCVIFLSPTLLCGDDSSISSLAVNIAQSWAGHLVTCANYHHFWLHKSFSMFVGRKIICKIWTLSDAQLFYKKLSSVELNRMIDISNATNSLKTLIPDLTGLLPINFVRHVPYELGCIFLDYLENNLGGSLAFEKFLKSYFFNFAYKSIKTDDWKEYLNNYFAKVMSKKFQLQHINWDLWLHNIPHKYININYKITWEIQCSILAKISLAVIVH